MRVSAAYLYPDFLAKRNNDNFNLKKSKEKKEKSFEDYLQYYNKKANKLALENKIMQ
ncbi:hypothetical protein [Maledivibacter halophilus]|uniref:Uncharacterized protein n=1 Tax=Maledivibacter halophilus TaxID=36842 RepID=A0A1T5L433_9FIRM|nr:hypothetical protein [Maledivibacter halophilus]SKC70787.1 hypothetical protein SAMN02194393_02472 [Maledivibacter halophilus]